MSDEHIYIGPGKTYFPAPWTPEQVESLNRYQVSGVWHEFTCGNDSGHQTLIATQQGWVCPQCDYTQNWAFTWMADWTWTNSPLYHDND